MYDLDYYTLLKIYIRIYLNNLVGDIDLEGFDWGIIGGGFSGPPVDFLNNGHLHFLEAAF